MSGVADSVRGTVDAAAVGAALARSLVAEHGTRNPRRLAEFEGVRVERDAWTGVEGVTLLGTYRDGVITLYPTQIRAAAREHSIPRSKLTAAVLAHELGHHLLADAPLRGEPPESAWKRLRRYVGRSATRARRKREERAAERFATALLKIDLPEPLCGDSTASTA